MSPPYRPRRDEIRAAAAAIANARGGRRGVPAVSNILDVLPPKLLAEVLEDADEALKAAEPEMGFELARLKQWVADLQSGLYVNCVYCGHRYGPGETTPVTMADALKAHVEQCPEHPMAALRASLAQIRSIIPQSPRVFGHLALADETKAALFDRLHAVLYPESGP